MADNRGTTGKADNNRINVDHDYEVNYWANEFGVSRDDLRSAIAKVGPILTDVRAHLRHRAVTGEERLSMDDRKTRK